VVLRPIRCEDEPEHANFIHRLTRKDIRFRFFGAVKALTHEELQRFTCIDYAREMALIASAETEDGGHETLGVVRVIPAGADGEVEFAIVIRSDLHHQGLGRKLMAKIIRYCRDKGVRRIVGEVLSENRDMLNLMRDMGFERHAVIEDHTVSVTLAVCDWKDG